METGLCHRATPTQPGCSEQQLSLEAQGTAWSLGLVLGAHYLPGAAQHGVPELGLMSKQAQALTGSAVNPRGHHSSGNFGLAQCPP